MFSFLFFLSRSLLLSIGSIFIFIFTSHRAENIVIGCEVKRKTNLVRSMIIIDACKNSSIISHMILPLLEDRQCCRVCLIGIQYNSIPQAQ